MKVSDGSPVSSLHQSVQGRSQADPDFINQTFLSGNQICSRGTDIGIMTEQAVRARQPQ